MYSSRQKIYQDLRSQLSPHRMLTLSLLNLLQIDGNVAGISGEVFFWCDTLNKLVIFVQKRSHHGIFESIEAGIMDGFSKKIKTTPISLTLADLFLNSKRVWQVKPL